MNKLLLKEKIIRPNRIIQFGEGNFLRAFVDYIIDSSNEAGVFNSNIIIVKPIEYGNLERFKKQDNKYTVILRGIKDKEIYVKNHIVSSISQVIDPFNEFDKYNKLMENEDARFIVSNTTEAGIVYDKTDKFEYDIPKTFPGKITKLLFQRYNLFNKDLEKGFIFLPVELIANNGDMLKKCIMQFIELWELGDDFKEWVEKANIFTNTLVDRIVSGYPKNEEKELLKKLGYKDELMATCEPFGFWAIGSEKIDIVKKELVLKSDVEIVYSKNISAYKIRKVRILNGAHTSMIMAAYLYGMKTVEECMENDTIRKYMKACIFDEIIPTIDLEEKQLLDFANSVIERFKNPFLNHKLLDISLNSTSKWKARVMPSFKDSLVNNNKLPKYLTFSFAAYLAFYINPNKDYEIKDSEEVKKIYKDIKNKDYERQVNIIMSNIDLWDEDLTKISGFESIVKDYVNNILDNKMEEVLKELMK